MSFWTVIILTVFTGVLLSIIVYALMLGIGPVPTGRRVKRRLEALLPPEVRHIAELGCGWGTLLRFLAHRYPNSRIFGYERSPFPCICAFFSRWLFRLSNVSVHWKDFFSAPLHQVDLVVCYLFPKAMHRLSAKLRAELKPGTWVLTHTFSLPDWQPVRLLHADDLYHTPIYLYRA